MKIIIVTRSIHICILFYSQIGIFRFFFIFCCIHVLLVRCHELRGFVNYRELSITQLLFFKIMLELDFKVETLLDYC